MTQGAPFFRSGKGFFAGSGSAAFANMAVCDAVLELTGKFDAARQALRSPVSVAYLGTATYDLERFRNLQTDRFAERGCEIIDIRVAAKSTTPPPDVLRGYFDKADVVLVSGGNTLYAIRRWREENVVEMISAAASRGAVMAGGSAGAICWFDGGHSDSMDPSTYWAAMVPSPTATVVPAGSNVTDESQLGQDPTARKPNPWKYIRVSGLGFLPGLLCPHYDRTQSNGVPRSVDFDAMLQRHSGEHGIAIDHWAALVLPGDGRYHVFQTPEQRGSLRTDDGAFLADASGAPWCWSLRCDARTASITRLPIPAFGDAEELFTPSSSIALDPLEGEGSHENPTHE